jgi:hypothetical protein
VTIVVAVVAAGCVAAPPAVTPPSSSPTTSNRPVTQPATTAPGPWRCPSWSAASAHAMTDRRIIQPSGLAASRVRSGIWWTHNDTSPPSPKVASLYALEESTGDVVATLNVTGVGLHRTFLWHRRTGESVPAMLSARPVGDCIYADNTIHQDGITPQLPDLRMGEALGLTVDATPWRPSPRAQAAPQDLAHPLSDDQSEASARPAPAAASAPPVLTTMLRMTAPVRRASASRTVSKVKVENVV